MDNEINDMGYRYYTLESRPIPYRSPPTTTHPASVRAKEAADSLNQAYLEALDTHQTIKTKLEEFKRLVGQREYTDLATCFLALNTLAGQNSVTLICNADTNEPIELVGGAEEVEKPVLVFNEMLDNCHQYINNVDVYLDTIKQRINALRSLAVMQQILTICSTFETHASTNVNIFATEIRSLLQDTMAAAKQNLK
jgi:hypothetical protein